MTDQLAFDYRNSDPDTSRLAAVFNLPNRSEHQARVLAALQAAGERGLTDFGIEAVTGIKQTSCGKRRLDLFRQGLVGARMVIGSDGELKQDRRLAPSGTPSLVWVAIEFQRADARPGE